MPKARASYLVPFLGLLSACGPELPVDLAPGGEELLPIINGEACDPGELDTAIAILVDADVDFGSFGQQQIKTVVCTGTLIAPDVVLTAAHCLDAASLTLGFGEVTREDYYVTFESDLSGLTEQMQGGQAAFPEDAIKATRKVFHENFNLQNFENVSGPGNYHDIGLLFLEQTIDDVEPEVVITADEAAQLEEGADVLIAGWGQQTQTSGPFEAPPPGTVGKKICAASFVNELGSHEMQIGGDASTSRKCHGDSGGPTYFEVTTEHARTRRVIGITSHAYDQEDCAKGGVDTRVDAWLPWFDEQMTAACQDGTRVWCDVEGLIPPSFYDPPPATDGGDGKGKDGDGDAPPGGCGCGESESGDPSLAVAALGLFAFGVARRRRR